MDCPRCKENTTAVIAEDSIKCGGCGKEQLMQYWFCGCGYNFRTNCGVLIDGWDFSPADVEMSGEELVDLMQNLAAEVDDADSLMEYMHPCVRCGSVTTYESSPGVYSCSECDFEWETLANV